MSATTIRTDIDATRAGVPPAPPEAHQQAGVVSGHGYSFTVPGTSSPELLVQDGLHFRAATPDEIVAAGRAILLAGLNRGPIFDTPMAVKDYVRLQYGALEHEVFAVMFLDSQHRLIAVEEMFRGSLSQTSVYPREVLKSALKHNAGATLLVHCHPSGQATPSRADEHLTQQLKTALQMIDVRVLDHLIATRDVVASMAELGLI